MDRRFQAFSAMQMLGMQFGVSVTEASVNQAWRAKMRQAHPDKCRGNEAAATLNAQNYNAAKDILMQFLHDPAAHAAEKRARDAEDERKAREKELEAKRRAVRERKELAKAREREIAEARELAVAREIAKAVQFARARELAEAKALADALEAAERLAAEKLAAEKEKADQQDTPKKKNRFPRKPGSRIHRKLTSHYDGKKLVDEMRQYFVATYQRADGCRVMTDEILEGFKKSRPHTTQLESNLFQRHSKKLFSETIQGSKYGKYKDKRCFVNVTASVE